MEAGRAEAPHGKPGEGNGADAAGAGKAVAQEFSDIDGVIGRLGEVGYVCDRALATVVLLATRLGRPLLLEGEAGIGKTAMAQALSAATGRRLIRLQCYEGLDLAAAAYDWNFAAQMIAIRTAEATAELAPEDRAALEQELFGPRFLIERPLLQALRPDPAGAPILLIDELDRADAPFEAFLLEALADFQISIPELRAPHSPVRAPEPPLVVITSNRTRDLHDALRRRCLYHWLDYPDFARELDILRRRLPTLPERLSHEVVAFVQALRQEDLFKRPGIAETVDWAACLLALDTFSLSPEIISDTLGAVLKYQDDIERLRGSEAARLLERARLAAPAQMAQP